jgi:hypothetical protein
MTIQCDCGSSDVTLLWDNGAEFPETRVEKYECNDCGSSFRKLLTA